jgi:drug/metabolite transporter (DMT)-like permease
VNALRASRFAPLIPLLFVVLWSTGFIGAKLGLPDCEPLTLLSLRYAAVLLLMGAVTVVGLQPVLTALGAGLLLQERVRATQWAGLALGLAGVVLVVAHKVVGQGGPAATALLVPAAFALLGITAGTLYQKRFCPRFDLRSGSVIQFLPCLVATGLVAWNTETMVVHWTPAFTFALAWLVLVLSLGAVSLLNMLIRSGSAVNVASLFYLTPPTTALIAWAMFGETLTGLALAGMGLAVLGVWLARK